MVLQVKEASNQLFGNNCFILLVPFVFYPSLKKLLDDYSCEFIEAENYFPKDTQAENPIKTYLGVNPIDYNWTSYEQA